MYRDSDGEIIDHEKDQKDIMRQKLKGKANAERESFEFLSLPKAT